MSDEDAVRELRAAAGGDVEAALVHFFYFPSEREALPVLALLEPRGLAVTSEPAALGDEWSLLAKHRTVPTLDRVSELREEFERLACEAGGEYDGWEAEVCNGS